jgi:hypothetical protein
MYIYIYIYIYIYTLIHVGQVVGVEGGYSNAELAVIDGLVKGQCDEIVLVVEEWKGQISLYECYYIYAYIYLYICMCIDTYIYV